MYTVYEHWSPSNKVYVGITKTSTNKRWRNGKGYSPCILFNKAILKYGWDNFIHKIVSNNILGTEAKTLERSLIAKYKSLGISYNITIGGDAVSEKAGKAGKDNPMYGRHTTNPMYGKKGKNHPASIPIYQYSLEGVFIRKWGSTIEAARELVKSNSNENSNASCIATSLKEKKISALGYIWRYEYIENIDMSNYYIVNKKNGVKQLRKIKLNNENS